MAPCVTNCGPDIAGPGEGAPPTPPPRASSVCWAWFQEEPRPHVCGPALSGLCVTHSGCPLERTVRADVGSRALCMLVSGKKGRPALCLLWLLSSPQQMPV